MENLQYATYYFACFDDYNMQNSPQVSNAKLFARHVADALFYDYPYMSEEKWKYEYNLAYKYYIEHYEQ